MDWTVYTMMTLLLLITALRQMYNMGRKKGYDDGYTKGWYSCKETIMFMIENKERGKNNGTNKTQGQTTEGKED